MPYLSSGSSGLATAAPAPPTPAVIDKLAELSVDEPLPETYSSNRIRLLAQSPRKLFLYWEFARDPYETLARAFGGRADRYTLIVKLIDLGTRDETLHIASPTRSQWLDARSGKSYRAEVGFYAQGRTFIRLLSSGSTHTPRAGVSSATDSSGEFRVAPDEFARVLDDAGFVSDALEVSLEAADAATNDAASLAIARRFGGANTPELDSGDVAELRGLLAALALGANVADVEAALSARLSQWLNAVSSEREAAINGERILEVLRTMLGIELERSGFGFFSEEAVRRAARAIVGGSDVRLPLKPFHLWMPSMTTGILKIRAEN